MIFGRIGRNLYKGWMAFARGLAFVNTTLLLTIIFFLVLGPSWLVMKLRRKDFLERAWSEHETYWKPKEPVEHTRDRSLHQF